MSEQRAVHYDPIVVSAESTLVAEYVPDPVTSEAYQSEAELEAAFIAQLQSQAYEYLAITTEADLIDNLRTQLERLNQIEFSDTEWQTFFHQSIASANDTTAAKTHRIQENHKLLLQRDDGSSKNVDLIDKTNIHNNHLQVINQYTIDAGEGGALHANRYDVTILVNGLPMVHVELKRRGVLLREAFNQIRRYDRESFWAGSGLFNYVQLFVISNGTHTKYYANTTRERHVTTANRSAKQHSNARGGTSKATNTFEFTSWWADANNTPIQDLTAFAKTFFAKHSLLNVLTKYCVFNADQELMVMRPYQIAATEAILLRIYTSTNQRQLGTVAAGGYVWHTTGSGKTLTSFKAAQLATRLDGVDKVLFVVDRKDLDYQTMREYDRFQQGAANSNTSTAELARQLRDPNARIIITTIQKLSKFIASHQGHQIYSGHVVLIFDECHRSQFGDMHTAITRAFKRYHLFGFTGTPIFADNAGSGGNPQLKTTAQAFGDRLHTYTIVHAITDKNVLPFRVDYINTIGVGNVHDKMVSAIDTERALMSPKRMRQIAAYILEHFDQKTRRHNSYELDVITNVAEVASAQNARSRSIVDIKEHTENRRHRGFNAIFATASIEAALRYYALFAELQMDLPADKRLKIAMIYSHAPNQDVDGMVTDTADGLLGEEDFNPGGLTHNHRQHLQDAIYDYNDMFGTSYDVAGDTFQNYYKDLSLRLKNREVDLVIVVNMFLTGFDAKTLNTLFVDKNLRSHGLIQAFSRTNRILNSVKTYGNVVCFRDLQQQTDDAIALFGDANAGGIVTLAPYADYYSSYLEAVDELLKRFPLGEQIIGESNQKAFVALFNSILRLQNILVSFDEFAGNEALTAAQMQNYQSTYNDIYDIFRREADADKEGINDDVVFEIELVKQVEINVDYILMLVEQSDGTNDADIKAEITRNVNASPSLRHKRDLIEAFVASVSVDGDVAQQWRAFIAAKRTAELDAIIADEHLDPGATRVFMHNAFRDGYVSGLGTAIETVLPPVSKFAPSGGHGEKKQRVLDKLTAYHERFADLADIGGIAGIGDMGDTGDDSDDSEG